MYQLEYNLSVSFVVGPMVLLKKNCLYNVLQGGGVHQQSTKNQTCILLDCKWHISGMQVVDQRHIVASLR